MLIVVRLDFPKSFTNTAKPTYSSSAYKINKNSFAQSVFTYTGITHSISKRVHFIEI